MQFPFAFLGENISLAVLPPTYSPPGGTYPAGDFPITVTISVQSPATHFRYTLNDPNIDENTGTLVNATSGTVQVNNRDILRAIALDAANRGSHITIDEYDHVNVGGPNPGGGGNPPGPYP